VGRPPAADADAIVEDALRSARAQNPGSNVLSAISNWDRRWVPPTEVDHDCFETAAGEYAEALRAWLGELDEYLTDRARLLACAVVQTNPPRSTRRRPASSSAFPRTSAAPQAPPPASARTRGASVVSRRSRRSTAT